MTIGPFVELTLGVAYLMNLHPACACLGAALNLPMTKATLIEDLTMAAMAAAMLVMRLT